MKRAAFYVRVSTTNQEDEQTIESQIYEIKNRIEADGNLLLPEFQYKDDGWTGTLLERPSLDQMRSDARNGAFEILYFYDRGRIARKFVYQEIVLDELRECDIEFISLRDINGTTPEEQLMGNVMGIFHEYERVKITERMRLGKMRKVRDGKLLGYNPPYGYDYHARIKGGSSARDGYFTVNEAEALVIRQIFEWVADGVAIRDVIRRLYDLGIPPRKQKRVTWTKEPVVRLLQNTSYIGQHYYNKSEAIISKNPRDPDKKYRRVKKTGRTVRPKEDWMPISVPRIVSDELFQRVHERLELNIKFSQRNNKRNEYLLTSLIYCTCGKLRTGDPGNRGYLYYRCTDRLTRFPLERQCHERGVNSPVLDAQVWSELQNMLMNPGLIREQAERWYMSRKSTPTKLELQELAGKNTKLDEEEKRYVKAYGLGYMPEGIYHEQMRDVASRRKTLDNEMKGLAAEAERQPQLSVEQLVAGAVELLQSFDFTDKKFIVRKLITKVVSTQKEAKIWGHLPVITSQKVGLHASYRYRWLAQRW